MTDKQERIKELLTLHGPLGVNALSQKLDISASTLQAWLTRQSYFIKTEDRKWSLPYGADVIAGGNFERVIQNQAESLESLFELIKANIQTTVKLIRTQKPAPIAPEPESPAIDKRLSGLEEHTKKIENVFIKQKKNIPSAYIDLILNFDYIGMVLREGQSKTDELLEDEVFAILSGQSDILSDKIVEVLMSYQKKEISED